MDWQVVGAAAEALGAILVIASLLFVAIELRRNTKESRRHSMEDATSHRNEFVRLIATDASMAGVIGRGLTGTGLDAQQWFRFNFFLYAIFVEFEFNQRKFQVGDIDADLWDAWLDAYRWWLQFPGVRKWWASGPAGFTQKFRDFVDVQLSRQEVASDSVLAEFSKIDVEQAAGAPS